MPSFHKKKIINSKIFYKSYLSILKVDCFFSGSDSDTSGDLRESEAELVLLVTSSTSLMLGSIV